MTRSITRGAWDTTRLGGRVLCGLLFLLVMAVPVSAQTHECDATPATSATLVAGALSVGWCHDGRDTNGNQTSVASWVLYADAVRMLLTNVTTTGVANTGGLVFYAAVVVFPQGNYIVTVAALNGIGEGPKSSPFALVSSAPSAVPRAPVKARVS